jgi:tetratricopeptide (TPR) repeat protein
MRRFARSLIFWAVVPWAMQAQAQAPGTEKPGVEAPGVEALGKVSFAVSCSQAVSASFNRGVALLHDFWYDEAQREFKRIADLDPSCAMAHWGAAMSGFHQIWDRPDEQTMAQGWAEMQKAAAPPARSARERAYIAALGEFFKPGTQDYQARIEAYSAAMADLYRRFPGDVDAGAFYALSLLAEEAPNDTSLAREHEALAILNLLSAKSPDHPGVLHYTIHACDTPSLASQGLAAARRYGEIASSGAHAVHMPGHIFARLGLWQEDIKANLASVAAAKEAQARGQGDGMDQFHSDDFLIYAYLQSGQEARAKSIADDAAIVLTRDQAMPGMTPAYMRSMFPYYRNKFPAFYYLEMRDWKGAAALEPVAGAEPESRTVTYWARIVAHGHLHEALPAGSDFAIYESLLAQIRRGKNAYLADSVSARIRHDELVAWLAFAESRESEALEAMRRSADLQDKVGQGEVDIPAREMLADMLLELGHPDKALIEYQRALDESPGRFNALFNAGRAAEAVGNRETAADFYATLLKSTDGGQQSQRPEFGHVNAFLSAAKVASK